MKLMNFRRLDPQYTSGGKTGLVRGAKEEEEVWKQFAGDPRRCRKIARAITASLDEPEDFADSQNDYIVDDFVEAPEGRLLSRRHVTRERNRKLVEQKKRRVMQTSGKLECEACGFDFALRYGTRGNGFIECHHLQPVTTLAENGKTHVNDLAVVCANCHRIIHRGKPWLTVAELKTLLVVDAYSARNQRTRA
ncbi:MAG: HNH endonuclease [Gammaproteobacteria bacterium]